MYSLGYFLSNLKALALSGFPLVAIASHRLFVLERRACPVSSENLETIKRLVGFGSLAGRPIARFTSRPALPYVVVLLAGVGCFRLLETDRIPTRRLAAERIAKTLPMNAAIVSSLDPVFLEHMLSRGRSDLRVIPLSRTVEYASKVITEARVAAPSPPPSSWSDHRCPGLFKGGAYDAVPFVASERITELQHLVEAGGRLYIDLSQVPFSDVSILERIRERMEFTEIAPFVYRLSISNDRRTGRGGP